LQIKSKPLAQKLIEMMWLKQKNHKHM